MSESAAGQLGASGRELVARALEVRIRQGWQWLAARDAFDLASALLLVVLIALALWTFQDFAVSNDEGLQHHYGELIIAYYKSGFTDRAVFHYDNLYLYGGLFDVIAVALSHVLPVDPFELRHLLCALIGIGGIAFAGATARLIAGARAGFFAMMALTLCGSWYGAMFNHTKGVPLGAFMAGAIFFLIRAIRALPQAERRDVIGFGALTGAALGIKSLSLLLVGYFGLALLIAMPRPVTGFVAARGRFVLASAWRLLPGLAIAYLIMIAAWPWAALEPLNPIRGLLDFGDFHYHIRTVLFGQFYEMADVPRYYVPTYIVIRLPLLTLGAILFALLALMLPVWRTTMQRRETAFIAFTALFPVACQVAVQGPALDGCRHFLFVFPPLAVLAGIGLSKTVGLVSRWTPRATIAALAVIATIFTSTALKLYELHPYEYLYYNQLVGGLQGASRRFVTDYWVNIMPEAVDELHDYLDRTEPEASASTHPPIYRVAVCGERVAYEEYARPNLQWIQMSDWRYADFYIAPTHMNCDRNLDGTTIARIERMGVTIGVVKDRRAIRARGHHPGE